MPGKKTTQQNKKEQTKKVVRKETMKKDIKKTNKSKKTTKPKTQVVKKENPNSKRHFSIIYNGEKLSSTPSGKRPKQAANKALTAIFKTKLSEAEQKDFIDNGKEIHFELYENGRNKKNAKGLRRIFKYTGMRVNTCDYCLNVDFCDDCKKKLDDLVKKVDIKQIKYTKEELKEAEKSGKTIYKDFKYKVDTSKSDKENDEINKKRFVMKNLKLYKRYIFSQAKKWKYIPSLNAFIEENKKVYDTILKCKKCKKSDININHTVVKYCNKCDDIIKELNNDESITKKEIIKNINFLKEINESFKEFNEDSINKIPNLNKHIKNNLSKYISIVNCKQCEIITPDPILYKYTNIVRKSTDEDLKDVKSITSQEIDKIEEALKQERKEKEKENIEKTKDDNKKTNKPKNDKPKDDKPKDNKQKIVRKSKQ